MQGLVGCVWAVRGDAAGTFTFVLENMEALEDFEDDKI